MESFKYKNRELAFTELRGEVIGADKRSSTHLSSTGGGGYIGPHGGHISSPTISSFSITHQEIWIKDAAGREHDLNLTGWDVAIRVGQQVSLIYAGDTKTDTWYRSVLVNHSAGQHWFLGNGSALNRQIRLEQWSQLYVLIAVLLFGGTAFLTDSPGTALVVSVGFFLGSLIVKRSAVKKLARQLDAHLDKLAQRSYQKA